MADLHHLSGTSELSSCLKFWHRSSIFLSSLSFHLISFQLVLTHFTSVAPVNFWPSRSEQDSRTLHAEFLTARSRLCRFETNMPLKHANMTTSRPAALFPAEYPTLLNKHFECLNQLELGKCCRRLKAKHVAQTLQKACTKYFPVLLRTTKLAQSTSQYYFVLQSLHHLAPSTSQYYFVLQSLHKARPSSTSYYKDCTKYFPVLLLTLNLAQSTSQYYFSLYTLRKVLPSTPPELAQSTYQYYFLLQSLHKVLPSTTSYYKAWTKDLPVLLPSTTSY